MCVKQIRKGLLAVVALIPFVSTTQAQAEIAQSPLFMDNINVSGNLVLVPSVEWPTINSLANLGDYDEGNTFVGYFDSGKCYTYTYTNNEDNRRFEPAGLTSDNRCTGSGEWSGNFLNWAATQTIDPFRLALTGGYRVRDTATETWLEKARHDGEGGESIYPNRTISGSSVVSGATPFSGNTFHIRIHGLGNEMRFRVDNNDLNWGDVYQGDYGGGFDSSRAYNLSVRVSVCDDTVGVEDNCVEYNDGWKPEGLIQSNADSIRYSVVAYLNDSDGLRDGGVLRARQKYVGPQMPSVGSGLIDNPNAEWDAETGVQFRNPDAADAAATESTFQVDIDDSGVINYINKFGQLTNNTHKSVDPVSELYYAALRYVRNEGEVSAYSDMSGVNRATRQRYTDGFPVITDWDDPVEFMCQANVALGIGDVYTHRDKNLPGSPYGAGEPGTPPEVNADNWIDVVDATNRVSQMEGLGNIGNTQSWTGRNNSAYLAGLAYIANTTDMRPDMDGTQTMSTYWVDVLEDQTLEAPEENQFYLAAKYGGFDVPSDFNPYDTNISELEEDWWHTNNETLVSFGPRSTPGIEFNRPDNYFVAGRAVDMVAGLENAFQSIISEMRSNVAAVAVNSSRLDTDTVVYQGGFDSATWTGLLQAYDLEDRELRWDAAEVLNEMPTPSFNRNIFTYQPDMGQGREFRHNLLSDDQVAALSHNPSGIQDGLSSERVQWLRGQDNVPDASFRQRVDSTGAPNLLGDIINSDPQYVGKPNYGYSLLPTGGPESSYSLFRASDRYRERPDMVYVGANDGMLHGFLAETGEEVFAYMPASLLEPESADDLHAPLSELMHTRYSHRYYVDGTPEIHDAYLDSEDRWATVLVGTLGAGGRSVFALDVTNPADPDEAFSGDHVLWEFSHSNLGYGVEQARIVRLAHDGGTWAAVFGNGYGGASGESSLFVVNLDTGDLIAEITTETGGEDDPNGMAMPYITDWPSNNRVGSVAYSGDLHGNLWRVDLSSGNADNWEAERLIAVEGPDGERQPITSAPVGTPHPDESGTLIISFGTGAYFRNQDANSMAVQSLYGVFDTADGNDEIDLDDLQQQQIIWQGSEEFGEAPEEITRTNLRVTSNETVTDEPGWRMDLHYRGEGGAGSLAPEGERVISRPSIVAGPDRRGVRFTTLIPDEAPCGTGRDGYVMELDVRSGARPASPVFDFDGDGQFDEEDMVEIDGELVPVSGIGGITQGEELRTVEDEDGVEQIVEPVDPDADEDDNPGLLGEGSATGRQAWEQLR